MEPADVVVLGAGPSGLAVAGEVRRRGRHALVLERSDAIVARWRTRYSGLRLNTWSGFSRLPRSRMPRSAGRYASRERFIAYLEDYARRQAVDVRLGAEATRVERYRDGGWVVSGSQGPISCRNVVVATGWDAVPTFPDWVGGSAFAGPVLHASEVRELSQFARHRVLVVGAGNTGIDLAGLLVRAGAEVTVSMRTPPNIFPRDWLGVPLGPIVLFAEHGPSRPANAIGRFIQWQVYGDLTPYGIPPSPQGFLTRFRGRRQPRRRRWLRQRLEERQGGRRRRGPGARWRWRDPRRRPAARGRRRDLRHRLQPWTRTAGRSSGRAGRPRGAALQRRRAERSGRPRPLLRRLPRRPQRADPSVLGSGPASRQGDRGALT